MADRVLYERDDEQGGLRVTLTSCGSLAFDRRVAGWPWEHVVLSVDPRDVMGLVGALAEVRAGQGGNRMTDEQYISRLEWAVVWLSMMLTGGRMQREPGIAGHEFDAERIRMAMHVSVPGAMPAPQRRELDAVRNEEVAE